MNKYISSNIFDQGSGKFLPTGSDILNLLISDRIDGGFEMGRCINIIGDKNAGKSMLSMTCLAEASHNIDFDDYELYYDDTEAACGFDIENLFGKKTLERIKYPGNEEEPTSRSVEAFIDNLDSIITEGKPFVYILDSLDTISSVNDEQQYQKEKEARMGGKAATGSYGMQKPKQLSSMFRRVKGDLKKTNSLLIIVSQTRDNINPMSMAKKTRSGGKALGFYSDVILWLAVAGSLHKTVNKKKRPIGTNSKIKLERSKTNGGSGEVIVPIYRDYGIDNTASILEWLKSEDVIEGSSSLKFEEAGLEGRKDTLIKKIEEDPELLKKVQDITQRAWDEIIEATKLKDRRNKYV